MLYTKKNLIHKDYVWKALTEGFVFMGEPTRRSFDPFNGDQVLFIINVFCKLIGKNTIPDGKRVESLLREQLPPSVRSEVSVIRWLDVCFDSASLSLTKDASTGH